MQSDRAESRIVGIGKPVDEFVEEIAARDVVLGAGGGYKFVIEDVSEERIWEVAEELFEDAGNTIDVIKEVLLFAKVDGGGICSTPSKSLQTQSVQ